MVISLPSALGVIQVAELHGALSAALEADDALELDARGVEEADHGG